MTARMDIENFFQQIDSDLLEYAPAFRKLGFTSSQTMKYWREHDFQNLEVNVPEGHRRLILNMITKLRTPELKSSQCPNYLSKKVGTEKNNLRSRRNISDTFTYTRLQQGQQSNMSKSETSKNAAHQSYSICDLNPVYTALFASGSIVKFL